MADFKGLYLVLIVLVVYVNQVTGECTDSISKKNSITLRDKDDPEKEIAVIKKCKDLAKKYPDLCENTKKSPSSSGTIIGGENGLCCKSCGDPNCLDKVTKTTKFTVGNFAFTSCKSLVKKFPAVCLHEGQPGKPGRPGGVCCQTCKGISTKCVDFIQTIKVSDTEVGSCATIVKKDKCRCDIDLIKDSCCASCAKVDTAKCKCRDFLGPDHPYRIITEDLDGNVIMDRNITKCKDIVRYYAEDCAHIGGEGKACCKTCEGVDTTCFDNIAWKGTVRKCVDCTCHEIRGKSKMAMKNACKNNIKGSNSNLTVREACCLQCKLVGF